MADSTSLITRRSALAGHYSTGHFGAVRNGIPGIVLQERPGLAVIQVDAWSEKLAECQAALADAVKVSMPGPLKASENSDGTGILTVGPGRWLITEPERRDLFALLSDSLSQEMAVVVDLSHSRVCWRLSGSAVRDLMVKGSTIDFDPERFQAGDCVGTLLGHFTVTIHCRDDGSFDLYGVRSFAVDLDHWLHHAAMEFGLERTAIG